jgi:NAD(P)-dependent dehydrogenase (short-subunit alcohol dehydrogenase family)
MRAHQQAEDIVVQVFVSGHTRGLGAALARLWLAEGVRVYGLARGTGTVPGIVERACDLADHAAIAPALTDHMPASTALDVAVLNAGALGPIADLRETSLAALRAVLDLNTWSNKLMLDWFAARPSPPRQVVLISSGASIVGQRGWGGYALSKAALNMLAQLYAHEMPATHLVALAPGLIDTGMQRELRAVDAGAYPAVARLHAAHGTPDMPDATTIAGRLIAALPRLRDLPSGSYVDLRKLPPAAFSAPANPA